MTATQLNMWAAPKVEAAIVPVDSGLRSYQEAAVAYAERELKSVRATMLVMATGSGKTRTASSFIRRWLDGSISF